MNNNYVPTLEKLKISQVDGEFLTHRKVNDLEIERCIFPLNKYLEHGNGIVKLELVQIFPSLKNCMMGIFIRW